MFILNAAAKRAGTASNLLKLNLKCIRVSEGAYDSDRLRASRSVIKAP